MGTLIGHAPSWSPAYSITPTALNPGTTYYLNIEAINGGGGSYSSGGLLGEFSVTGGATFANGSQTALTGDSGWVASYNNNTDTAQAWLQPTGTVSIEGPNGSTGPWGTIAGISSSADWVWATDASSGSTPGDQCAACTVDFQIAISTAVPEPASAALTFVAVTALGLVRRRKPARRGSACRAAAERCAG